MSQNAQFRHKRKSRYRLQGSRTFFRRIPRIPRSRAVHRLANEIDSIRTATRETVPPDRYLRSSHCLARNDDVEHKAIRSVDPFEQFRIAIARSKAYERFSTAFVGFSTFIDPRIDCFLLLRITVARSSRNRVGYAIF